MNTLLSRLLSFLLSAQLFAGFALVRAGAQDADAAAETAPAAPAEAPDANAVDAVIKRARAFLGSEAALNAVNSIHLFGTVTAEDGKTHKIEIIMQRPMQQLVTETTDEVSILTVLDDYTGWRRIDPPDAPGTGRIGLMTAQLVRLTRANVAQTLFYYNPEDLAKVGGKIALVGEATIDGILCDQVVFTHPGDIEFVRFFDRATGQLVLTRTNQGTEARESGEQKIADIRFPKELHTQLEGRSSKLTFDEIRVNEEFAAEMFKMPMPKFDFGRKPSEPTTTIEPPMIPEEPLERDLPPAGPEPTLPEPPRDMSVD